jgi:hypothetical protein
MVGMNLRAPGTTTNSRDTKGQVAQGSSQPTTGKPDEALDKNPLGYRTLSYPSDITNNMENGHYMLFYVNVQNKTKYAYRDPEGVAVGDVIETKNNEYEQEAFGRSEYSLRTGANAGEIAYQEGQITQGKLGNILSSDRAILTPNVPTGFQAEFKTTSRITDSVALYLPANVSDKTAATYEGMETGIAGLIAAGGGAFVRNMRNNDYEAAARSLISGTTAIAGETVKRLVGEVGAIATGTDEDTIRGLAAKAFGTAENPFIEMLFKQMNLREFSYEFTFSPRNQREAEEVQAIIKLFRFHMAPELMGNNKRYLRLPSTFDIHYMYQHSLESGHENNFYSKIATCVLSGVDVDYTPGGVKSFQDGSPTQITMGLSFQETELLTKDMINKGY